MWYWTHIGGGRCPIVDTWWQTETGAIMISPLPGATTLKPGSATFPLPGIGAELVDDAGNVVDAGRRVPHPHPAVALDAPGHLRRPRALPRDLLVPVPGPLLRRRRRQARRRRLPLAARPRRRRHEHLRPPHLHHRGGVGARRPPGGRRGRGGRRHRRHHRPGDHRLRHPPRRQRPHAGARRGGAPARRPRSWAPSPGPRPSPSPTSCPRPAAARSCAACSATSPRAGPSATPPPSPTPASSRRSSGGRPKLRPRTERRPTRRCWSRGATAHASPARPWWSTSTARSRTRPAASTSSSVGPRTGTVLRRLRPGSGGGPRRPAARVPGRGAAGRAAARPSRCRSATVDLAGRGRYVRWDLLVMREDGDFRSSPGRQARCRPQLSAGWASICVWRSTTTLATPPCSKGKGSRACTCTAGTTDGPARDRGARRRLR